IERLGLIVLAQDATAEAVLEDVLFDLLGGRSPLGLQLRIAPHPGQLRRTVEGDPAHELRGDVMLGLAARLPDPLVGLLPDPGGALRLRLADWPQSPRQALRAAGGAEG